MNKRVMDTKGVHRKGKFEAKMDSAVDNFA